MTEIKTKLKKIKTSSIKVGDKIKVIAGDQKGFLGSVLSIAKKKSTLFIDGISPRIKFAKNPQGGESKRIEIPLAIHFSNVMLWDKDSNQSSRIGFKEVEGTKKRYFKKSGNLLP